MAGNAVKNTPLNTMAIQIDMIVPAISPPYELCTPLRIETNENINPNITGMQTKK